MIKLNWERPDPKYHPCWWEACPIPVNGSFDHWKFEKLFKKHFEHARIEMYITNASPPSISITFENEEDSARFIMLVSSGIFGK
jgi:hypothetical protein